jgi:colicin import membrane protein
MSALTNDRDFLKNFMVSFGGHLALVLIAYAGGDLMLNTFRRTDVEIIRSSVRVDVVGMPKFTVQELKELQKSATPQPQEPVEVKGATEAKKVEVADVIKENDLVIQQVDKKKTKASFMNLVADYSSQKVAPKAQPKGAAEGVSDKRLESLVMEGNRLSKGSALVGDFSDADVTEFSAYVQTVPELIRPHWKLPTYLLERELRCRIRVFLAATGKIVKLEVMESSGVSEFDARAEKAVRDAAPFPKPSDAVGARLAGSGIVLGFPL